jgi:hypothetical protein
MVSALWRSGTRSTSAVSFGAELGIDFSEHPESSASSPAQIAITYIMLGRLPGRTNVRNGSKAVTCGNRD